MGGRKRREIAFDEHDLAGEVETARHPVGRGDDVGAAVYAVDAYVAHADYAGQIQIEGDGEVGLAAAAVHDGKGFAAVCRARRESLADHFEELVDLIVFAAHRSFYAPFAVGEGRGPEEGRRIESGKRQILDPVVGTQLDLAVHLGRTRDEHMALLRHPYVQIALGRHEMKVARALLGDQLVEAGGDSVSIEILHRDASVIRHLGLEAAYATNLHGADGYLELRAAAPDGLYNLHETLPENAGANLLFEGFV